MSGGRYAEGDFSVVKDMPLAEFVKGAPFFYPGWSKVLYKRGIPIARYSAVTHAVTLVHPYARKSGKLVRSHMRRTPGKRR